MSLVSCKPIHNLQFNRIYLPTFTHHVCTFYRYLPVVWGEDYQFKGTCLGVWVRGVGWQLATGVRVAEVRTSPWGPLKSTRTATQRRECGFVNFHDIFFSCFPYTLMQLVCTSVIPESFASIHSQSCISVFMFDCILTIVS